MKKSGFNMNKMLLLFSMVPLVISVVIVTIASVLLLSSNLEEQTKRMLTAAATDLKSYSEADFAAGFDSVQYDSNYIDSLKSIDIDLTVFVGDTRFCTSVLKDDGKRNEGTQSGPGIWDAVSKGETYYSNDTQVAGKDYYVIYLPLKDASGKIIGMSFAGTPRADVKAAKNKVIGACSAIAAALVVISVICVIILSRKVSGPIRSTADTLETIAKGDFTGTNDSDSPISETKSLILSSRGLQKNISSMLANISDDAKTLAEKVEEVNQLAEQSNSSSEQISSAIGELADGATSMAQNVQSINEQVMEMGNLINEVVEDVDKLGASANAMQQANNEAYGYIGSLEKSSTTTMDAVAGIKSQVVNTNEAITRITSAVGMITDIASQTNLLALNASIEAARAGEMGKGFAVVAESIGNLANQSAESTAEIRAIIDELTKQSEQSVLASESVEQAINEEQVILDETKKRFDVLNEEITSSVAGINGISAQTENLESIKATIIENVSDLSAISQENAASTEEVSASMESIAMNIKVISDNSVGMNDIADNLVDAVGKFTF